MKVARKEVAAVLKARRLKRPRKPRRRKSRRTFLVLLVLLGRRGGTKERRARRRKKKAKRKAKEEARAANPLHSVWAVVEIGAAEETEGGELMSTAEEGIMDTGASGIDTIGSMMETQGRPADGPDGGGSGLVQRR